MQTHLKNFERIATMPLVKTKLAKIPLEKPLAKISLQFRFLMPQYHYALAGAKTHTKGLTFPYLFTHHDNRSEKPNNNIIRTLEQ
jgi:hypothetical protein